MNKLAVLGTVLSLCFSSFAAEPWMSPKWTGSFVSIGIKTCKLSWQNGQNIT